MLFHAKDKFEERTMLNPLKPIEKQTLAQSVIERLVMYVQSGALQPGDALPAQPDLARRLSVSRPVLREALQGLSSVGMIEIRPGSGCYVKTLRPAVEPDSLFDAFTHEAVLEVIEARMVIEVELAGFAAVRAVEADFEAMAAHLERLKRAVARPRATTQVTSDFHDALARAGHNSVLLRMSQLLKRSRLVQGQRIEQALPDIASHEYENHMHLFDAIRSRDVAIAREAMREHLQLAHGWENKVNALRREVARLALAGGTDDAPAAGSQAELT